MNNKGFTLVEILAAVTILAILTGLAIAGYTKYIDYAKNKAYTNLAKSASIAAEEFIMDNPGAAVETEEIEENGTIRYVIKDEDAYGVSFSELIDEGYLSGAADPNNKGSDCRGTVKIGLIESQEEGGLDQYIYEVDECCSTHYGRYKYLVSKKGDKVKSVEEIDTSMDRESICPSHSFKIVEYSGMCEDGRGHHNIVGRMTNKMVGTSVTENEREYYYEEGMNFFDWTKSKHGRSYIDAEMNYYGYSESERSYVQEVAAYELNSIYTGCYPSIGVHYSNYEEECSLDAIKDGTVIRRNKDCYSFNFGIGSYGYYAE